MLKSCYPSTATKTRVACGNSYLACMYSFTRYINLRVTIGNINLRVTIGNINLRVTIGNINLRVTIGDSDLYCCACVTAFECYLTPVWIDAAQALWASLCFRFMLLLYVCIIKPVTHCQIMCEMCCYTYSVSVTTYYSPSYLCYM